MNLLVCLLGLASVVFLTGCGPAADAETPTKLDHPGILKTGFVALETVYNSELMAPYDVFQHSIFRDSVNYMETFIVSPDGEPFTTFEGIQVVPHYSFETVPDIDVLVIPSTGNSMGADLENEAFVTWLTEAVKQAKYVVTVCDGAFPLAATGALDGRTATTFPSDRDRLAELFPEVDVRYDVNFVRDGKFITSVGGALSYEPAFYLVEAIYGADHVQATASGLVWDWDLGSVPHLIVEDG